ncbi:SpoIIE family protein phosphatase [Nonomuraea sp. NPDC046570]|uniref:SpoIIE family protein phosphatase n=1 Tax=Nonomuraea sp. NPDC046570 TaxID=3155255 RepID=UPI0033E56FDC
MVKTSRGISGAGGAVAVELLSSADPGALLSAATGAGLADLGVDGGLLYLQQDDGWLRLAAQEGSDLEAFQMIPPDAKLPVIEAIREQRHVYAAPGDRDGSPDAALDEAEAGRTAVEYATLPLSLDGRCLGILQVRLRDPRPLTESDRLSLTAVASLCAHRLDHLLSQRQDALPSSQLDQAMRLIRSRSRAARLELAMSSAEIGSFDWDFTSGRLVWDERICRLMGIEPEDFNGRSETFFEAVHPDDRAMVEDAVRLSYTTGRYHLTHRIVRPDGAVRWMESEARVYRDAARRPQGMIGVVQDRTRDRQREAREQARRDFVLDLTRSFAAALSTEDVVDVMEHRVLPALGGSDLAIYMVESGRLRLVESRGFDTETLPELRDAAREPRFLTSRQDYLAAFPGSSPAPRHRAWAFLPLATADGTVGACVIGFDRPRTFPSGDQVTYAGVAGILAQSLDRAMMFDKSRRQMTELQRLMLPKRLPEVPGLQIASRYLPGSEGLQVGGDWYDVISMPDGRIVLVIGDVQGHSAQAAAVMGQLRTAMRAHAAEGHGVADLMLRGNQSLCDLDTELFATCCIIEVDLAADTLWMVRAGHPYPLLLEDGGRVRELESAGGMPLGCFAVAQYPVVKEALPKGGTLLLYTDGLVEKRGQDYDEAVAELSRRLTRGGSGWGSQADLDELADQIVAPVASQPQRDDIAMLLLRRT